MPIQAASTAPGLGASASRRGLGPPLPLSYDQAATPSTELVDLQAQVCYWKEQALLAQGTTVSPTGSAGAQGGSSMMTVTDDHSAEPPGAALAKRLTKDDHVNDYDGDPASADTSRTEKLDIALHDAERARVGLDPAQTQQVMEFQRQPLDKVADHPSPPPPSPVLLSPAQLQTLAHTMHALSLKPPLAAAKPPAPSPSPPAASPKPACTSTSEVTVVPLPSVAMPPQAPQDASHLVQLLADQIGKSLELKVSTKPLKNLVGFQDAIGQFTMSLLRDAMAAAANDQSVLSKLQHFELYFKYERLFYSLVCDRSWSAAAHFHKETMAALARKAIKVEVIGEVSSYIYQATCQQFQAKHGSCPAHPGDPHTEMSCKLRLADKVEWDKLVAKKTG